MTRCARHSPHWVPTSKDWTLWRFFSSRQKQALIRLNNRFLQNSFHWMDNSSYYAAFFCFDSLSKIQSCSHLSAHDENTEGWYTRLSRPRQASIGCGWIWCVRGEWCPAAIEIKVYWSMVWVLNWKCAEGPQQILTSDSIIVYDSDFLTFFYNLDCSRLWFSSFGWRAVPCNTLLGKIKMCRMSFKWQRSAGLTCESA